MLVVRIYSNINIDDKLSTITIETLNNEHNLMFRWYRVGTTHNSLQNIFCKR